MKSTFGFGVIILALLSCFVTACWAGSETTKNVLLFDHRHLSKSEAERIGNDVIVKYDILSVIGIGDYSVNFTKKGKFIGGTSFGPAPYEKPEEFLGSALTGGSWNKMNRIRIYVIYNPESPIDWNTVPFKVAYPNGPIFYRGAKVIFVRIPTLEK